MMRREGERLLLQGALNMDTVPALLHEARLACREGIQVVDFTDVTEADSAAIAFVLELQRSARERDRRLAVTNPPQAMRNLAAMYGVTEQLGLADS